MRYVRLAAVAIVLSAGAANAATILQARAATSSVGSYPLGGDYDIGRTIDQSSLSVGYTSGVTYFDTYVPSTAHLGSGGNSVIWYAPENVTTATITFDLGGAFALDGFALWADWQGVGQTVKDFRLTAATDAAFISAIILGDFVAADGTGAAAANLGQSFRFGETTAAFVKMDILSNHGSSFTVGFGEAAFRMADEVSASPVPVPAALPLLLSGLLGIGLVARRRKQAGQA